MIIKYNRILYFIFMFIELEYASQQRCAKTNYRKTLITTFLYYLKVIMVLYNIIIENYKVITLKYIKLNRYYNYADIFEMAVFEWCLMSLKYIFNKF